VSKVLEAPMLNLREKIRHFIPWLDPFLEYFDLKKFVIATVMAAIIAVGSFIKDLPWPVIAVLAFATLVQTMYLIVFPRFIRILKSGEFSFLFTRS
jgi:hypothetical protein